MEIGALEIFGLLVKSFPHPFDFQIILARFNLMKLVGKIVSVSKFQPLSKLAMLFSCRPVQNKNIVKLHVIV
jgi:hypothetical protein